MSSSDAPNNNSGASENGGPARWGRVFMGPDVSRESSIDKILNAQERELWNRSTEIEYLKRVRDRATAEARELLEKAQARADAVRAAADQWAEDVKVRIQALHAEAQQERAQARAAHAEADQARAEAHEAGFQAGMEHAAQTIAEHEYARDAAVGAIARRIQEQCGVIFEAWRGELTALAVEAVETSTGWILREERASVLAQLLVDSVAAMEQRLAVTARINPQETDLLVAVLNQIQSRLGVQNWHIEPDPSVELGGLILENDSGRVDNLPSMRRSVVEAALERLTVPPSAVDAAAVTAVQAPSPELDVLPDRPQPDPAQSAPAAAQPAFEPSLSPEIPESVPDAADLPESAPAGPEIPAATLSPEPLPEADFSEPVAESVAEPGPAEAPADDLLDVLESTPELLPEPTAEAFAGADLPEEGEPAEDALPDMQEDALPDMPVDLEDEPQVSEPERRAMEMAAAAMDKALGAQDSLPDDVAAYIMDAVTDAGSAKPSPAVGEDERFLTDAAEPEPEKAPAVAEDAELLETVPEAREQEVEAEAAPAGEAPSGIDAAPAEPTDESGAGKAKTGKPADRPFDSLANLPIDDDGSQTSLSDLQDISALLGGK